MDSVFRSKLGKDGPDDLQCLDRVLEGLAIPLRKDFEHACLIKDERDLNATKGVSTRSNKLAKLFGTL